MFVMSLLFGLLAAAERSQVRQVFTAWDQAKQDADSLVVEFDFERRDPIRNRNHRGQGTFNLIRTKAAGVSASFSLKMAEGDQSFYGLLHAGKVYELDSTAKTANCYSPIDPQRFLARHFLPLVVLLDRERADAR